MIEIIISFIIGAFIGFMLMACLVASKGDDRDE